MARRESVARRQTKGPPSAAKGVGGYIHMHIYLPSYTYTYTQAHTTHMHVCSRVPGHHHHPSPPPPHPHGITPPLLGVPTPMVRNPGSVQKPAICAIVSRIRHELQCLIMRVDVQHDVKNDPIVDSRCNSEQHNIMSSIGGSTHNCEQGQPKPQLRGVQRRGYHGVGGGGRGAVAAIMCACTLCSKASSPCNPSTCC